MLDNVLLGVTIVALLSFTFLAFIGTTVSAWYVVVFIVAELITQITKRMYDMS